jgi:hypothetical protein
MRAHLLAIVLILSATAWAPAQSPDNTTRAREALARARAAIGDEGRLGSLRGLSLTGTARRLLGDREASSEVSLDILLPDKMKRVVFNSPLPGVEFTTTEALNGGQVWFDSTLPAAGGGGNMVIAGGPGGGGGGNVVIMDRSGGGGGGIGFPSMGGRPGGESGAGTGSGPAQQVRQQAIRLEFTRLILGLLATAPASVPVEYAYIGEAKAPDGTADVVEVKGPGSASTRLFIDKATGRVLMLSFRGKNFQAMRRFARPPGSAPPRPEEQEKLRKEIADEMAKAPDVDYYWRFGDYKSEGGLMLPHLITKATGETISEEWAIGKYKINPSLKAGGFEKKQ